MKTNIYSRINNSEWFSQVNGSYGIRLDSIETEIEKYNDIISNSASNAVLKKYGMYKYGQNPASLLVQYKNHLNSLERERKNLIEEIKKEEQALIDQEILKQKAAADAAKAAVEKALAEIEAAKNKSAQEQAKAQQELAKAQAAQQLAESGKTDDAARLLGQDVKSYKGLIIGGIILGSLGAGFIIYKMLAKKKVV